MWKTVLLILPVLVPSWRFFKAIEPSPRVQWALWSGHDTDAIQWHEARPRPQHVSLRQMMGRLFWNPAWNEALFLVSCAERIQQHPTPHSINEIQRRVLRDIAQMPAATPGVQLQFRLVFVRREAAGLSEEVVFVSDPFPATSEARR